MKVLAALARAGLSVPEMLTVALTEACNLDCTHCWVDAGTQRPLAAVAPEILAQLFADFADLGGQRLQLTGGEPLLHPAWRDLLARAADLGFEQTLLQTNGLLLRPADLPALHRAGPGLRIQISLDGACGATHDRVRGAGSFSGTLAVLQWLAAAGFGPRLILFFTEMQHNLHEFPELLALADSLGVGAVHSGTLVYGGRADAEGMVAPPQAEQYLELLEHYHRDDAFRERYARLGRIAALEWCCADAPESDCCRLVATPYLTAAGALYPCLMCHAADFAVPGVFAKGLGSALAEGIPRWTQLLELGRRRASSIEACRSCALRQSCAAGCMGRAWGSFGDFLAVEDRCQQRQTIQQWKDRNEKK